MAIPAPQAPTRTLGEPKYLGSCERGIENPSLKVIAKLAKALKVDMTDLFELEHEVTSKAALRQKLVAMLKQAELDDLQQALKMLKALLV